MGELRRYSWDQVSCNSDMSIDVSLACLDTESLNQYFFLYSAIPILQVDIWRSRNGEGSSRAVVEDMLRHPGLDVHVLHLLRHSLLGRFSQGQLPQTQGPRVDAKTVRDEAYQGGHSRS